MTDASSHSARREVTLINHSTTLIQLNGVNIITDPVYSLTVSFVVPRLRKPGIAFNDLPRIDLILVSHNHYDHLNLRTLRRLRRRNQSILVVPRGVGRYGRRTGFQSVVELNWWEAFEAKGVKVTCVPAKHFSRRFPWDHNASVYCGYVLERDGSVVYFAGDTGYGDHFNEISKRFSLDVGILPIGAYKPYDWFRETHLNPKTAVQAFTDLRAQSFVPIHWGTFKISDEPLDEPPEWLRREAEKSGVLEKIHVLKNGETFSW